MQQQQQEYKFETLNEFTDRNSNRKRNFGILKVYQPLSYYFTILLYSFIHR